MHKRPSGRNALTGGDPDDRPGPEGNASGDRLAFTRCGGASQAAWGGWRKAAMQKPRPRCGDAADLEERAGRLGRVAQRVDLRMGAGDGAFGVHGQLVRCDEGHIGDAQKAQHEA